MKYRSEIDGLRAIAVIPVVLFHVGLSGFSGGFIGVDIFFVISGYLITNLIIDEIQQNQFLFYSFLLRRARRILPALLFMTTVCVPFAWFLMSPSELADFSQTLIGVSLFISNVFLWQQSDYFAGDAEQKPLLHTWSLAVEEQYYLVFPLILIVLWRYSDKKMLIILILMFVSSLALSEWAVRNQPYANFYLAPTRAWELLVGSIFAVLSRKFNFPPNSYVAFSGLIVIIFCFLFFNKDMPLPSSITLIPVLATVAIILYAKDHNFAARFIGNRLFVKIGLVSYSIYIWHQPVLAFSKITDRVQYSSFNLAVILLIILSLSTVSYATIEKPFRNISLFSNRFIAYFSIFMLLLTLLFGLTLTPLMLKYKYSPENSKELNMVFKSINYDMYDFMANSDCKIWTRNPASISYEKLLKCSEKHGPLLVVLGDSHAMNLFNILSYSDKHPFILGVSQGGCRPYDAKQHCHYDKFKKFALENKSLIDVIYYHQSGSYFIEDTNGVVDSQRAFEGSFSKIREADILAVSAYLEDLHELTDANLIWVGPHLEFRRLPEDVLFTDEINYVNPESVKLFSKLESQLLNITENSNSYDYRSFNEIFYEPDVSFDGNCFVFKDTDHYSTCGEKIIGNKLNYE